MSHPHLRRSLAPLLALPALLLVRPPAADAQAFTEPSTAVFITYDNSLSMDYTTTLGVVPLFPETCDPANYEYARTRHVIGTEALTGSFQDYCPIEQSRTETLGYRDDGAEIPHTVASYSRQRRDGILDVYADSLFFGLGTFDSVPDPSRDDPGDHSYGPTISSINLGLTNHSAHLGPLISPLPPGWLPGTPGALSAFRLNSNQRIQDAILEVVPGLGSPIAAALDDVQHLRHFDAGLRSDPFNACRPFAHVLVTDGQPLWDQCYTSADPPAYLDCGIYKLDYSLSVDEAANLANGDDCTACSSRLGEFTVPTYVVAFAIDDPTSADLIAEAGGTCAVMGIDGVCIEHAFRAEAQAELVFALGTVFNRFLKGHVSMIPPITSTVAFEGDVGLVRFSAGANISQQSPYWTGTLERQVSVCQEPEPEAPLELLPGATIQFEDQFVPDLIPDRNIYTARLDVAAIGASCERPNCPIDAHSCYDSGAVPDPQTDGSLYGFGDGTGGLDSGGTNPGANGTSPGSIDCTGADYTACVNDCADNDACICECQIFFECGYCGYVSPTAPACDTTEVTACIAVCEADGEKTEEECLCHCEDLLDCGTCHDGPPDEYKSDAPSRDDIDNNLTSERSNAAIRGNDDPLPTPPAGVDFNTLEIGDSCLIPFDEATFVSPTDLSASLYAENSVEAARIVGFTRGLTLDALAEQGKLSDIFDPALVALHDRSATGYVGDFFHSEMAFLGRPSPRDRTTPGFDAFVSEVGILASNPRPYTLFAGANDGMLHAFDAITGSEMWAIIPPSFLPQLGQAVVSHRILVDGPVVVRDLKCSQTAETETWCSLLAVSYRGGGSGAMVLDVTHPQSPRFLFEVTGQQIPELGLGYPRPLLGNALIGAEVRPVLVLAGGRPLNGPEVVIGNDLHGSNQGELVVILDALTGEIYRQFDPVSNPYLFAQCGPVTGSPTGWSPDLFTRIFAGTQRGCLLRVDTSSENPLDWTIESIYQTDSHGEISFAPALATRADGSLVIVFGHGNTEQFEHINQQGNLVSINETRGFVAGDEGQGILGTFVLVETTVNWEIELAQGEFLTTAPIISDGIVFVGTWVPNVAEPCTGGGSRLYGIDFVGDPDVAGPDSLAPYRVGITSGRIVARLSNPFFDPEVTESQRFVKFFDADVLGTNTVIVGLGIEAVPDCQAFEALAAGEDTSLAAGSTERRLIIDILGEDTALATADAGAMGGAEAPTGGGEEPSPPPEDEGGLGVINLEYDLPQPTVSAVALDWGVIIEF